MRNYSDVTAECDDFDGETSLDPSTQRIMTVPKKKVQLRRMLLTFIVGEMSVVQSLELKFSCSI